MMVDLQSMTEWRKERHMLSFWGRFPEAAEEFERRAGIPAEVSMREIAYTNELVHILNNKRRQLDLNVRDKIDVYLYQLDEAQELAFIIEELYIMQSCQIRKLRISLRTAPKTAELVTLNVFDPDANTYVEIPHTIGIVIKKVDLSVHTIKV